MMITCDALDLINREWLYYQASLPTPKNPYLNPLLRCDAHCTFFRQYGLLCRHTIAKFVKKKKPFTLGFVHPRWHFRKRLDEDDEFIKIRDLVPAITSRGRPKKEKRKRKVYKKRGLLTD